MLVKTDLPICSARERDCEDACAALHKQNRKLAQEVLALSKHLEQMSGEAVGVATRVAVKVDPKEEQGGQQQDIGAAVSLGTETKRAVGQGGAASSWGSVLDSWWHR